jgi:hypothetical protein
MICCDDAERHFFYGDQRLANLVNFEVPFIGFNSYENEIWKLALPPTTVPSCLPVFPR